ncbi:MAG TPA: ABC transporter permease [Chryseolinea sp.]|nr:ABC transporter permease [Chryseolinea sp.]
MRTKYKPPSLAKKILLSFLKDELAEEVLGDLDEKFFLILSSRSPLLAKLNYWYQVFHYFRPFAIGKSRQIPTNHYAMLQSYFKIGWRNLLKNKGYSFINVGGLAMGMAVAMLIGFWIQDELSFNKYHRNYDTIGKVYRLNDFEEGIEASTAQMVALGSLLRAEYSTQLKQVVMVRQRIEMRVLSLAENRLTQGGYFMEPEGVEMFSLKMLAGDSRNALKDMKSIIVSASFANKLFGSDEPVNKIITMDGTTDLTVTGVYEDLPKNSEFYGGMFFAPLDLYQGGPNKLNVWDNYNMTIYVQLHSKDAFNDASEIIKNVLLPHVDKETADTKPRLFIHPMAAWHLNSEFKEGKPVTSKQMKLVWSFGLLGGFVLLLACINFMNLSTARSATRAREVGIRKSIGSLRSQLIQQFFGESLLVAFLSFVAALCIVKLALPLFNDVSDKDMEIPWANLRFWVLGLSFALTTGLVAGIYPALYLSSFNPVKVLKGTFKAGRYASFPRSFLVTLQFTVSICLIIGTVVIYQQIQFAKNRPIGYSREGLISLHPRSPEFKGKYQVLRNELKKSGVIAEMAEANYAITSTLGWNGGFSWRDRKYDPSFNTIFVTHEYGQTVGWEFIQGRDFSREIASDLSGIVINESASKILGLENPIGESLTWKPGGTERGTYKILGVVKDMVKGSPFEPTDPSIIFLSEDDLSNLYIRINPKISAHQALPEIQKVFKAIVPSAPFDYTFADEDYAAKFRAEERIGTLAAVFTVLAILISCLGLFGLASFVAEQRTKEIGIRKVLGASIINVWQMLSRDFIGLVVIASLIAVPIAFYIMNAWLEGYVYRINISPWILVFSSVGALVITVITVSFQAIKAGMMNPVKSLRSE